MPLDTNALLALMGQQQRLDAQRRSNAFGALGQGISQAGGALGDALRLIAQNHRQDQQIQGQRDFRSGEAEKDRAFRESIESQRVGAQLLRDDESARRFDLTQKQRGEDIDFRRKASLLESRRRDAEFQARERRERAAREQQGNQFDRRLQAEREIAAERTRRAGLKANVEADVARQKAAQDAAMQERKEAQRRLADIKKMRNDAAKQSDPEIRNAMLARAAQLEAEEKRAKSTGTRPSPAQIRGAAAGLAERIGVQPPITVKLPGPVSGVSIPRKSRERVAPILPFAKPTTPPQQRQFAKQILQDPGVRHLLVPGSPPVDLKNPDFAFHRAAIQALQSGVVSREEVIADVLDELRNDQTVLSSFPRITSAFSGKTIPTPFVLVDGRVTKRGGGEVSEQEREDMMVTRANRYKVPLEGRGMGNVNVEAIVGRGGRGPIVFELGGADAARAHPLLDPNFVVNFIHLVADQLGVE